MASYTPRTLNITKNGNTYTLIQGLPYGVCDTLASETVKSVTVDSFTGLEAGVTVNVKFTYGNSTSAPSLRVNSGTAKPIYKYGTTAADNIIWNENAVYSLTYDGTGWQIMNYSVGEETATLEVDCGTISSENLSFTKTIQNESISSDMIVINHEAGNESAIAGTWQYETSAGSITISGNVNGTTTLKVYLMKKRT